MSDDRRYFERILADREKFDCERSKRMDERHEALAKALELQAAENLRRFKALNGEYERDRDRQEHYVTVDKYEDALLSEKTAREVALIRTNEKFDDYVTRSEQRVRELENAQAASLTAAEVALTASKDAAQKSKDAAELASRRANRNIAVVGVGLAILTFALSIWNSQNTDPNPVVDPTVVVTPSTTQP